MKKPPDVINIEARNEEQTVLSKMIGLLYLMDWAIKHNDLYMSYRANKRLYELSKYL